MQDFLTSLSVKTKKQRSKIERETDLKLVAELYMQGKTLTYIASKTGMSTTQTKNDLDLVLKRWQKETNIDLDFHKIKQIKELEMIKAEMWECWEKSKKLQKKSTLKAQSGYDKAKDGSLEPPAKRNRIEVIEEEGNGDVAYIDRYMDCNDRICKILGLFAPVKTENNSHISIQNKAADRDEILTWITDIHKKELEHKQNFIDAVLEEPENEVSALTDGSESIEIVAKTETEELQDAVKQKLIGTGKGETVEIVSKGYSQHSVNKNRDFLRQVDDIVKG